ncbi:major facilitator superfamily domain-containing protein [Rhexocercosporidium sp. MPI-PUGE-AT-0058]|nr:major facilitator superfamily domain-containing protein [Rhexocercosporidium sp. MPI-PUGE-AT-0058]
MSNGNLNTSSRSYVCVRNKEDKHELTQLSVSVTIEAEAEPQKFRSRLRIIGVLAGLNLSIFTSALDQTIIATAVPAITSNLHSASGYIWIGSAYLLANAAAGPIWAKLSDIWGRKPILLAAVAMFFGSLIISAEARNIKMVIIGRALQGTASGGMVQLVMIIISDIFSIRQRSLYFGLLEVVWTVAGGVGPVLGGLLTERLSWRWAFWVNLPICGSTFILLLIFLDVHNPKTPVVEGLKAVDWFGSISILATTLMIFLGLELGGVTFPWKSPQVLCLVIIGALTSGIFIFSEKRLARYPLMPLDLFKNATNIASLLLYFLHGMCYTASEYYLPLYFQSALEASPLKSGVLILPLNVTTAIAGILSGVFTSRTGRYLEPIRIGVLFMVLGNGLYVLFPASTSIACLVGFQIIAGFGQGLISESPLIAVQALASQDDTATTTSTFGFTRSLSATLSVVICGVIFQNSMNLKAAYLSLPPVNLPKNVIDALAGGHAAANVMIIGRIGGMRQRIAVKEAFVWSLRNMWIFTTCVAAIAVVASCFVRKNVLSEEHIETKTGLKEKAKAVVTNIL